MVDTSKSDTSVEAEWTALSPDGAIRLPRHFDLKTAGAVADVLQDKTGPITVRADEVEVMTSPGLQVLLSGVRDGARDLTFDAPSKAFLDCLALLGCAPTDFRHSAEA